MPKTIKHNITKAALISPIIGPLFYYFGSAILMLYARVEIELWALFVFVLLPSALLSYTATFCIGLPIYLILKKTNSLTLNAITASGALVGMIVSILFFGSFVGLTSLDASEIIKMLLIGLVLGCAVAFTFGRIAGITNRSSSCFARDRARRAAP